MDRFLSSVLVLGLFGPVAIAQSISTTSPATHMGPSASGTVRVSRYRAERFPKRAKEYYGLFWGVDSLSTKLVEAGEMVRFTYRVVDPEKARTLNDKKLNPYLIDERAHAKLVVPSMEKIGQLRQSSTPEAGKVYWMVFSNKGRLVKAGDRVHVVIGDFQAAGLMVQ